MIGLSGAEDMADSISAVELFVFRPVLDKQVYKFGTDVQAVSNKGSNNACLVAAGKHYFLHSQARRDQVICHLL